MFDTLLPRITDRVDKKILLTAIPYLGIAVGILSIGGSIFSLFFATNAAAQDLPNPENICITQPPIGQVVIYISGAVKKPGIYSLESGKRIADAVLAAGGLTDTADQSFIQKQINFAEVLTDSSQIYFPFHEEQKSVPLTTEAEEPSPDGKISINSASQKDLESLPKIGAKTAADIIAGRPFQNIQELVTKKIVTEKVFEEIKNAIQV